MALKPDDQYQYKTCRSCQQSKKVHCDNELLWSHEEWITENELLSDELKGLCLSCTKDLLNARLQEKFKWERPEFITSRSGGQVLNPSLGDWYNMYKESVKPR